MMKPKTERWKPIDGFEDYEVSSLGRVRSFRPRYGHRHLRSPRVTTPRILAQVSRHRYCKVTLCGEEGVRRQRYVHCLVLETFVGPCPSAQECRHLDGNRRNNRLSNLAWGTHVENVSDSIAHGTFRLLDRHKRN